MEPSKPALLLPGEIPPEEIAFRAGLLLAAVLFFGESLGAPLTRNVAGFGALMASALAVSTMAVSWRALGDWRQGAQVGLLVGLVYVLAHPAAAVISPDTARTALGDSISEGAQEVGRSFGLLPMMGVLMKFVTGMIAFVFLLLFLLILMAGTGTHSRNGITFLGGLLALVCLMLYPALETVLGFLFLGTFLYHQWERPLLISRRVARVLTPAQREFLRTLQSGESLSVGETRILLEDDPAQFQELSDFGYLELDPLSRTVRGTPKLLKDPESRSVEQAIDITRSAIWVGIGLVYLLMPDFVPGPFDELIVLALTLGAAMWIALRVVQERKEAGLVTPP